MGHGVVSLDDPAGQYEPAAQLLHALVRPVCALYVPAAQAVFVEVFGQ